MCFSSPRPSQRSQATGLRNVFQTEREEEEGGGHIHTEAMGTIQKDVVCVCMCVCELGGPVCGCVCVYE